MFYSQFILAKKGPLGTIWIAAHLERKLRKNQVADTDIGVSVDSILFPEMPIALRLSSHLLLGVVRIYSKKVNYLFDDCSEALLKVKQAFRSTAVDLPPEESTAPYHSITLPETFDLDDFELPDHDLQGNYVDQHISSKDQITLQDTMEGVVYSTSKFGLDERFGDGDASGLDLDEDLLVEKAATPEVAAGASNSDGDPQASVHANASDNPNEDLDDYDGDNEPIDYYAEAPSTPGLWEEPNLANVQETSACDDHQEPENHAVKENLEKVFPREQHHNLFESREKSPPHVAGTQQMLTHDLGATPFTELLLTRTVVSVSNDPARVEGLLNENDRNEDRGFQTANDSHENFVMHQGNQDSGVQTSNDRDGNFVQYQGNEENTFHLTTELESNTGKDNLVGTPHHHHTSFEPEIARTPVLFPHDSTPNSNLPSLRPCITFQNHETNAAGPHATEALDKNFRELHHAEIDQNHQVSYANDFSTPITQKEVQVENINSHTNDFPAPEKRLSLPHWLSDVPKNIVPESTPIEKDVTSGTKRSFAESSMTDHSLNLNESSGLYNTNMSSQSLNASSGFYTTDTPAQSLNLNQSSGFYTTNTPAQSLNLNQSSGFYPTNTPAQSLNLNQSSGYFNTDTTAQSSNLNQSSGFFNTDTTAQSSNLNQSSGFFNTDTPAQSLNLNQSSSFFTTNTAAQSLNVYQPSGQFTTNTAAQNLNVYQPSSQFTTNTATQNLNVNQSSVPFTTYTAAQSLNVNQSSVPFATNTAAQTLNVNQSSVPFASNTAVQSLNLNQSSGSFTINMTGQSVVNDSDMLSSILVGRKSSMLKMKPSPPVVTQSTKRRRSTVPKTVAPKRKVLMDDNMVLHGDTIRQQLTNTEDIRRLRKKAPCTRSEISMLEKQFWEDDIFSEPIFTGVSIKLASLHNQLYKLSKIVVSHTDASLEGGKDPKSISQKYEKERQLEVGANGSKENANIDPVAQPIELPVVTDNHTHDNNAVSSDYYGSQLSQPPQMGATEHVAEPFNSEHDPVGERTAMEIDPKSFPDADIGVPVMPTEVEPRTHVDVVPSETFDMSAPMNEVQADVSLQTDAPGVGPTEKMDLQSFDTDENSFKHLESNVASETNIDFAPVREVSEEKHVHDTEYRKNEEANMNLASNLESSSIQNSVYNGIFGEEYGTVAAYDTEVNPVTENVPLDERENPGHHVTLETTEMTEVNPVTENVPLDERENSAHHVTLETTEMTEVNPVTENAPLDERENTGHHVTLETTEMTEVNPVMKDVSLDERENPAHHVTYETTEMNVEEIPTDNKVDDAVTEFTRPAVENNTDFLNFDDDDDNGADAGGGDYAPDDEATRVIDNSGWSSRTKAVAKYLHIMFDKEEERGGKNMLAVNNLLVGKTRKEASRMFFETLVLKTKDYIHVEQAVPFENINIFPRAKLLKSDF